MFGLITDCVFVSLILLIFISTSVFGDCGDEQTCGSFFNTWCCPTDKICGSDYGICDSQSSFSLALIATIIVPSVFLLVICLTCCIHSTQREQHSHATLNTRAITNPCQQPILRGTVRVVHVRPIYNVGAAPPSQSYPSIYEAPPPSYEAATANLPRTHQSSSSSSIKTTAQ